MARPRSDANNYIEYNKHVWGSGCFDGDKNRHNVRLPQSLFSKIKAEAKSRGWSVNRMIVHLCEASIEGIE